MVCEILAQAGYGRLSSCSIYNVVFQGEQSRRLHGIQYFQLEAAVGIQEAALKILSCFGGHGFILGRIFAGGFCHIRHHAGIDCPVRGAQIAPVFYGFGLAGTLAILQEGPSAIALQRLVAEPVRPLVVSVFACHGGLVELGFIHMEHVLFHGIPVFFNYGSVAELFPDRPGHDHSGIGPTKTHHVAAILGGGRDSGERAGLALGIAHVAHPFMEEGVGIGEE